MRQGSVDVPRNSIAWEISRSSVAQWFTCFEDVQRKNTFSEHLGYATSKTVEAMIRVFPWGPWKPHASCGYVPIWSQFLVLDLQISKGSWLVLVIRDTEISFWIGTDQIQINFNRIFQIGYVHISNKWSNRIPHHDGTTILLPKEKETEWAQTWKDLNPECDLVRVDEGCLWKIDEWEK